MAMSGLERNARPEGITVRVNRSIVSYRVEVPRQGRGAWHGMTMSVLLVSLTSSIITGEGEKQRNMVSQGGGWRLEYETGSARDGVIEGGDGNILV
jgi:hypothetical protein